MHRKMSRRAVMAGLAATPVAAYLGAVPQVAAEANVFVVPGLDDTPSDIVGDVTKAVSESRGIAIETLLGPLRTRDVVLARQAALYLAKCMSGKSLSYIGYRCGGRDPTTVLHAVRKISAMSAGDPLVREDLYRLAQLSHPNGGELLRIGEASLRERGLVEPRDRTNYAMRALWG